ncbi:MAG TPA: hypothetical protein VEK38_01110 [Candidatus Bathyarchaeia archaeon]|nr:hypothetical protein [Candidatus Bathyarchaeia archaeon]
MKLRLRGSPPYYQDKEKKKGKKRKKEGEREKGKKEKGKRKEGKKKRTKKRRKRKLTVERNLTVVRFPFNPSLYLRRFHEG